MRLIIITFLFIFIICCKERQYDLVTKQICEKVDSLSIYKDFQTKTLFIIQHEKKDRKNFIKISTSEYFDKDSVSLIQEHQNKIIVYYSGVFFKEKNMEKEQIMLYEDFIYKDSVISIFHPKFVIFELTERGNIITVKKEKWKDLFLYDNTKKIEEL